MKTETKSYVRIYCLENVQSTGYSVERELIKCVKEVGDEGVYIPKNAFALESFYKNEATVNSKKISTFEFSSRQFLIGKLYNMDEITRFIGLGSEYFAITEMYHFLEEYKQKYKDFGDKIGVFFCHVEGEKIDPPAFLVKKTNSGFEVLDYENTNIFEKNSIVNLIDYDQIKNYSATQEF